MVLPCILEREMIHTAHSWPISVHKNHVPYAYQSQYFSDEECDCIIQLGQQLSSVESYIGSSRTIDHNIRSSTVSFFNNSTVDHKWIFEKITRAVSDFNQQFWQYAIDQIETLQFTKYHRPGDFYHNHQDLVYGSNPQRKLSVSVQLSADQDYIGSDLLFLRCADQYFEPVRNRGTVIIFPSFAVHKITPLISGTRFSLVSWVLGPAFR